MWPATIVVLAARRFTPRRLAVTVAVLLAGSVVWRVALVAAGSSRARLYHGTDTRAGGLLAGCLLAAVVAWSPRFLNVHERKVRAVGWVAAAVVVAMFVVCEDTIAGMAVGLPVFDVAAVAVVAACELAGARLGRVLQVRALVAVGAVSYGLYLWHDAVNGLMPSASVPVRVAVFSAATVASWVLVEQPFLRLKDRVGYPTLVRQV